LRVQSPDSNRSRWPVHPLWLDLQAQAKKFKLQEPHPLDASEGLAERMARNAISVYGYIKNFAALNSCLEETPAQNYEDVVPGLIRMMDKIHDPLLWKAEIKKRMDVIRIGHAK
jgi:hypothetical protein